MPMFLLVKIILSMLRTFQIKLHNLVIIIPTLRVGADPMKRILLVLIIRLIIKVMAHEAVFFTVAEMWRMIQLLFWVTA